jgi:predicted nucleic acid-binding protein
LKAVVDTGFVVAVAITTDAAHQSCLNLLRQHKTLYVPQSTLAESLYLITKAGGNTVAARFLRNLPTSRYTVVALEDGDFLRTAAILEQYADSRIDFVDASVVAVAERLGITRVLTLDRRDFDMVRPLHTAHFELLPE